MEAKELRIGNWVEDTGHFDKAAKVSYVQITAGDLFYWEDFSVFIEPILLTPEILEKCGFETNCFVLNIDEYFFLGYDTELYLQVEKQKTEYVCERLKLKHIKYVHQLQNLYFTLTGEEIDIKAIIIMGSVTFNISKENLNTGVATPPIKESEKIRLHKNSWFLWENRIKNKLMVYRLLKKKFTPYIVSSKPLTNIPNQFTITLMPYNY